MQNDRLKQMAFTGQFRAAWLSELNLGTSTLAGNNYPRHHHWPILAAWPTDLHTEQRGQTDTGTHTDTRTHTDNTQTVTDSDKQPRVRKKDKQTDTQDNIQKNIQAYKHTDYFADEMTHTERDRNTERYMHAVLQTGRENITKAASHLLLQPLFCGEEGYQPNGQLYTQEHITT